MADKKKLNEIVEEVADTQLDQDDSQENQDKSGLAEAATRLASERYEVRAGRSKNLEWYVVHTYSGHENKVKANIEKLVENRGMQNQITQVIVPTEDRVEMTDTGRKVKTRKIFPGYVIVKMIATNEAWYLVRNVQGVTGFIGEGSEPIPLTDEEIRRLGIEKVVMVLNIDVGDHVRIISGPFKGFTGLVEEVHKDKQTLRTKVDMFGRATPVELEFDQVDKIE